MHLSKLPSGNGWRVVVQHQGQRRSGSAPTKTGAQQVGANLLLELGARPDLIGGHTVGALLDEHLATQPMSEGARYDFRLIVKKCPLWVLKTDIQAVDPYTVERWYERLQRDGWTVHRVRKLHTLLHSAFRRAKVWRWCTDNPISDAKAPGIDTPDPDTPDKTLTAELLAAADLYTAKFGTFVRVAANTGARRGEICGLQWGDVDLEHRTLTIRRSISFVPHKGLVVSETKTGRKGHRAIGLGPAVNTALTNHHATETEHWLQKGIKLGPTSWVFTDDARDPWTPAFTSHAWKHVRQNVAGGEHVKLHALRHAVATRLLASGTDARTVAGRLGHSNPSVTLSTYARFVPANDRDAAELLDEGL